MRGWKPLPPRGMCGEGGVSNIPGSVSLPEIFLRPLFFIWGAFIRGWNVFISPPKGFSSHPRVFWLSGRAPNYEHKGPWFEPRVSSLISFFTFFSGRAPIFVIAFKKKLPVSSPPVCFVCTPFFLYSSGLWVCPLSFFLHVLL